MTINPLACIYAVITFGFVIAFVVDWIMNRKKIWKYLKYGLWCASAIVVFEIIIVAASGISISPVILLTICIAEPIILVRTVGIVMLGLHYASVNELPGLPILLRWFPPTPDKAPVVTTPVYDMIPALPINPPNADSDLSAASVEPPDAAEIRPTVEVHFATAAEAGMPAEMPASDVLPEFNWKRYALIVLGASFAGIAYSTLLFLLTSPKMSSALQQYSGISTVNTQNTFTFVALLAVIEVAIGEEILFRLGIQNFLAKMMKLKGNAYWIAIAITSTLWTLGHAGVMDPEWVKLAQIFPMGLLLGWLYKKYGAECTILVHAIFNVVLLALSGYLIH